MTRVPGRCGPECVTCRRGVEYARHGGGKAADQYPAFNEHRRREGNDEQPDSQHRPDVGQQQRQSEKGEHHHPQRHQPVSINADPDPSPRSEQQEVGQGVRREELFKPLKYPSRPLEDAQLLHLLPCVFRFNFVRYPGLLWPFPGFFSSRLSGNFARPMLALQT